jgi:hypothetical protein
MICHKYKTIFVHIPKTGGTSVECMFGFVKYNEKYKSMREMFQYQEGKHWTAQEKQEHYSEFFENYYKWTIIRNPWEKEWSLYNMCKTRKKFAGRTFKEFLKAFVDAANSGLETSMTLNQVDFIEINKKNAMDEIVRFEDLEKKWELICEKIKKPHEPMIHLRNPKKRHIEEDYDQECIDIVAKFRKKDIEYFNYKLPKELH